MDTKIDIETAQADIDSWLDYKKVGTRKREAYSENISALVNAVCDGELTVNPTTKELTQELKFEIGEEKKITHLTYAPRADVKKIHAALSGVSPKEADKRVLAYISALTSVPKEVVGKLDSEDYGIAQGIAVFFI